MLGFLEERCLVNILKPGTLPARNLCGAFFTSGDAAGVRLEKCSQYDNGLEVELCEL